MTAVNLRRLVILVILASSIILLVWGLWPTVPQVRSMPIDLISTVPGFQDFSENEIDQPVTTLPEGAEKSTFGQTRNLVLEWSSRVRTGDTGKIRLTLEPVREGEALDQNGTRPPARDELASAPRPLIIQARLDMPGIQTDPHGEILQPLRMGVPLVYQWSLRPQAEGNYRGTIWLHLLVISQTADETRRQPLSVQVLEIESTSFLGLAGSEARLLGALGLVMGIILGLGRLLKLPF